MAKAKKASTAPVVDAPKKENAPKAVASEVKASKDAPNIFIDDRGLSWGFKSTAPKTLNIDGVSTKLEDILNNKEVMLELVYGNCNFVEQK